jgi:hypothetical protein
MTTARTTRRILDQDPNEILDFMMVWITGARPTVYVAFWHNADIDADAEHVRF